MSHHLYVPLTVIAILVIGVGFLIARGSRNLRATRERYIRNYVFPLAVRQKLARTHPEWSGADIERALQQLREFFFACLATPGSTVRMTSKPADDAWHEFIVCTHDYQRFCRRAFGRYLHHKPDEAKNGEAWHSSCAAYVAAFDSGSGHGHGHGHDGHGGCSGSHGHGCSSSGCSGSSGCSSSS